MARVLLVVVLLIASASGAGAIDQTGAAETNVERARNAMNSCLAKSPTQVAVGNCYNDIARRLAIQLRRAVEDRETPATRPIYSDATGIWGRLLALECDKIAKAEYEGGSGQGIHQQVCEVTLLAARLDVMRVSPDKY